MTDEMEKRVFEGDWPLTMAGFYIIEPGEAVPNVLLGSRRESAKKGHLEKKSDVFTGSQSTLLKDLKRWLNSSREEREKELESVRQRLDDAWDQMRKCGLKAKNEYREWLASRFDGLRNRPDWTEADLYLSRAKSMERWSDVNSRFRRQSERMEDLYESVDQFNAVSGRYCEIRRIAKEIGRKEGYSSSSILINEIKKDEKKGMQSPESESPEGQKSSNNYTPKPNSKPERIINTVVDLIKKWGKLGIYENRAKLWREVYKEMEDDDRSPKELIEEDKGKEVSEALRSDMTGRKGFDFPSTVEEVEKLARRISERLESKN
ncbi:hypothetical protein GGP94_003024 [Salinibacter ruber]|uniref:hypothetical protein n=1 Tax=Salinibacter ruber TaxID=146919 RepID=UPI0021682683|nr:hypothetical protein [Salinibacter ruber]MCS4162579.1 hypothetical protein [Salinibacter ruber]